MRQRQEFVSASGGLDIDTKFMQLLKELLPQDITEPVEKKQAAQWMRQRQEFVAAKFNVPYELEDAWNVPFCFGINTTLSRKRKKKKSPEYKNIKKHIEEYAVPDYGVAVEAKDMAKKPEMKQSGGDDDDGKNEEESPNPSDMESQPLVS